MRKVESEFQIISSLDPNFFLLFYLLFVFNSRGKQKSVFIKQVHVVPCIEREKNY